MNTTKWWSGNTYALFHSVKIVAILNIYIKYFMRNTLPHHLHSYCWRSLRKTTCWLAFDTFYIIMSKDQKTFIGKLFFHSWAWLQEVFIVKKIWSTFFVCFWSRNYVKRYTWECFWWQKINANHFKILECCIYYDSPFS